MEDLTELAQSLKDFSRLDRAQQGQFNVNDGMEKTLLITKNKLKNKVTVHKHFGDVPSIYCSPSQINQVFLNLITNAADAIDDQGEVVVRTWEEDGNVMVSVADSGCGIPEDVMDKIRDPFFTTKEVGRGTGLGLSIVDRIVNSHNGELRIESQLGKGTVITLMLPQEAIADGSDAEAVESMAQAEPVDAEDAVEDIAAAVSAADAEPAEMQELPVSEREDNAIAGAVTA